MSAGVVSGIGLEPENVLRSLGEGVVVVDAGLRVVFANPAAERLLLCGSGGLFGRDLRRVLSAGPSAAGEPDSPVRRTILTGKTYRIFREFFTRRDGSALPVEYTSAPLVCKTGTVTGAVVVFRDASDRRRAERLLREREERFRVLFQNSSDVILVSDAGNTLRYASPSSERHLGRRPEHLVGTGTFSHVHPDDLEDLLGATETVLREGGLTPPLETRWRRADGSWLVSEVIGNNLLHEPAVRGVVLSVRDITERKALEAHIAHQAFHDPLTGLPNRALFMDRLDHALRRSRRQGRTVATLFMDLDNFKVVNDSLGHEAGDRLLVEVAGRIAANLREMDTASRLGGDEFTILLEDIEDERTAILVAERVRGSLREPFVLAGREVFVTASLGVALGSGKESPGELLRHADLAVYAAKEQGRDRSVVFTPQMSERAREKLDCANALKGALKRDEFVPLYLPQVSLGSGAVEAVEALLYWDHPERGRLSPAEFIPTAEETGIMTPIGLRFLEEVCARAKTWPASPDGQPVGVCVNLSKVQLRTRSFASDVRRILDATGLDGSRLLVEIPERFLRETSERPTGTLRELKNLGVGLVMDGYGTGGSSLSDLRDLPLDALKLDKTFVAGLVRGETDVVRAIVELAHTLGLKVVAEGVESAHQLAVLRDLGCEGAQGPHISSPLEAEELDRLLASGPRWR
ncbi:GGDEF: diguanylate cyclase (GGDEF) domain [Rubrobacter radiotolerans]|uniref:EAL domain-containing protein n=1 Tax=Rubrobacter radiotolerans TaxID=42256 RepID=A0A023X0E8_RUBRA|nr:bifunctional diguanylate cyclase/phosphodiesterase [Rubrobacter radiotolerans]AHY45671.1 GGDEF: diguanylate cyclase (GGDEF) domain [Rubrobacter radiotolerans]MDX5893085.1 EAL domain-containing protein [Rubrobacter radiotolerans]SMC03027.1 PAS domain S-box-containing protein/diguanylate cyclase (GGDEF) domain-containing protein [Rubrobacter radiotolerans DSM 5868]